MPRYALKIEYHGAPFSGWQRQKDQPSVQGAIQAALAKLEKNVPTIAAAGRTDAGVHSLAQVAHCDLAKEWDAFRLSEALNHHLKPHPIAIVACARVSDDFHARFSATERRYMFRLISRRPPLTHDAGLAWHVRVDLDLRAMQSGAERLLGRHDFTTFRSTMCQANNPIRTLDELRIEEVPYQANITGNADNDAGTSSGREFRFYVRARAFLHNQIRSFVGSLEQVGAGTWTPDDITRALEAKDRAACGPVCPPQGLYFAGVEYPEDPFANP